MKVVKWEMVVNLDAGIGGCRNGIIGVFALERVRGFWGQWGFERKMVVFVLGFVLARGGSGFFESVRVSWEHGCSCREEKRRKERDRTDSRVWVERRVEWRKKKEAVTWEGFESQHVYRSYFLLLTC